MNNCDSYVNVQITLYSEYRENIDGAYYRLYTIKSPSLICPNDNNGGKLSKFTVSDTVYGNGSLSGYAKVGLLTANDSMDNLRPALSLISTTKIIRGAGTATNPCKVKM